MGPLLLGLMGLGGVLGGGASGARKGRLEDAKVQNEINAANNAAQLNAQRFNLGAGATRMGQVARADLLARMQNAPATGDPRVDRWSGGGLRPSAFGPPTQFGAVTQRDQALQALRDQSDLLHPTLTSLRKPGLLEKIGGIAGLVSSGAGAFMKAQPAPSDGPQIVPSPFDPNEYSQS